MDAITEIATLIFTVISGIIGAVWYAAKVKEEIVNQMQSIDRKIEKKLNEHDKEFLKVTMQIGLNQEALARIQDVTNLKLKNLEEEDKKLDKRIIKVAFEIDKRLTLRKEGN